MYSILSGTWQQVYFPIFLKKFQIDATGEIPSPRFSHAVDITNSEKELIFVGGVSNTTNSHLGSASDEIFKLHLENWTWEKLPVTIPS